MKPKTIVLIGVGLTAVITLFYVWALVLEGKPLWMAVPSVVATALGLIGLSMVDQGKVRTGSRLLMVAGVLTVPLGLLTVLGARRCQDLQTRQRLARMRA